MSQISRKVKYTHNPQSSVQLCEQILVNIFLIVSLQNEPNDYITFSHLTTGEQKSALCKYTSANRIILWK